MIKLFSTILLLIINLTVFSQNILITDPDLDMANPMDCAAGTPPVFYDSGDAGGNYGPNENEIITICPDYANSTTKLSLVFGAGSYDIHPSDTLYIYDGPNTSSPLLGAHNNGTDPSGFSHIASFQNNPTGCFTIQFISDGANEGTGWQGGISCTQIAQPMEIHMNGYHNGDLSNEIITPSDTGYSDICFGDSILFVASVLFPNSLETTGIGYSQNNSNITYQWEFSDGQVATGNSVWFTPPARNGYVVTLKITDAFPYSQSITSKVRVSTIPNFSGVLINRDEICVGDTTAVIGAVTSTDTSGVDPTTSSFQVGGTVAGLVWLPDITAGNPITYHDTINISGFTPGETVTNISDLQQLCLNMEHSWLGDLEMQLTCPNGTTINIFNSNDGANDIIPGGFGGGGTYLGHPDDNGTGNPGMGENYCWSSSINTLGDFPTEHAANNFINITNPPSPSAGESMNWNGIYAPEESFTNLIGCPLNGDWSISVRDNLGADDGYIFEWSILFDPIINPNNETYLPSIVSSQWLSAATVLPGLPTDTFIIVSSNNPGIQNYTFEVTDNFDCDYDTTVSVQFHANPDNQILPGTNTVCQGTDVNFDITGNAASGFTYSWSPATNLPNSSIKNPTLTTDNLSGTTTYSVLITNTATGCTSDTFQDITVIPGYQLTTTQSATNICNGDIVDFTATPSLPLANPHSYQWTANTANFGTPNDSITFGEFNTPGTDTVYITVTEGAGALSCVRKDTLYVNTAAIPTIDILSPDTSICINGTATLYASGLGTANPINLIWDNGLIGNGPHDVNPTANTTYEVYAIDGNNCTSDTQEVVVTLRDPITINSIELLRPTICQNDTTTIRANAIGGGTNLVYTWLNGNGDIIGATDTNLFFITPSSDGEVFSVIVSDSCTTPTQTLSITSDWADLVLPTYIVNDSAGCFDKITPMITNTTPNLNSMTNVFWEFGDGNSYDYPGAIAFAHAYDEPGLYNITLTVTDQYGCLWDTIMTEFPVNAYAYPVADFIWNPNPTDYLNAQITFDNNSFDNVFNEWLFVTDADYSSNDINPVFQFPNNQPGNYDVTLTTTNKHGCRDSITKIVIIDDVFLFYMPTAFSPNGDGINDNFKVVGEGFDANNFNMSIFNKWGQLVFETSNPNISWDGNYKGNPVTDGVYIWKIETKEKHSPIIHHKDGFITILR